MASSWARAAAADAARAAAQADVDAIIEILHDIKDRAVPQGAPGPARSASDTARPVGVDRVDLCHAGPSAVVAREAP